MTESGNAIKVVLVGESAVGKTCIIERLCFKKYVANPLSTIGSANVTTVLDYGNESLTLEVWDTAGQETYRSLNRIFYKGAKIAVMVYDITNKATFEEIQKYWLVQIRSVCGDEAIIGILGESKSRRLEMFGFIPDPTIMQSAPLFWISHFSFYYPIF